ncbi:granzyme F-like isoform X4 [Cricetulus griseus]|uniref:Granzyme F-like isoform X4 n=1 Tax=Cricetulus griseus TaxID=10029 RepID=A0A9J7HFL1_CRIGR|nr:granzyme F-like isoform X4 [Cricetulus griseus]XP_035311534.1 granzyme F-like isoform X4 [Cricetulus griseus]
MSPVLILLIFLLQSGAGAEEIIGGHEVKPHSRPYMAFIQFVCDDVDICCCGGFLVRDDFVLTAAHCLGSSMKVTLGAHDVTTQEKTQQIIPVAKAIPHPDYNPKDHSNDIMLLRGDSGGPLVCDNRAYGIVSFGNTESISSGIFTKVVPFMQWIKRSMKPI